MRACLLLACLLLISCGRPLTPTERSFAEQIHGDSLKSSRIRLVEGALIGKVTYDRPKRPRLACRERIFPEPGTPTVTVGPAAYVIHNKVFFSQDWYAENYLPAYPKRYSLVHAMIFAHEITHAWQWQNRRQTGYSPLKAFSEHNASPDPYLFDITTKTRFLDYAYEQQASIVEEYVCCATLDPGAPRTKRLKSLIKQAMPVTDLRIPDQVILPWKDAQTTGICRI
ncbi:hypothetical protein [Roseovarius aestuariivivens]|uniref:hypothetical protein n=1 Tax=Roseovarius aestuariivivens TaxID=1888910 RepID=UPI001081F985|nr:hypothetical protein [Roseovarius aestuariivivens]